MTNIAKITNVTTFKEETRKDPEMSANIAKIAIFAKFADFSKPLLTFSLSNRSILLNLLFLLFLLHLLLNLFT